MQVRRKGGRRNVVSALQLTDLAVPPSIADYSAGEMEKHYKLLASQVGNLASRIASPKLQKRFLKAATTHPDAISLVHPEVQELRKVFLRCRDVLEERLDTLEISRGLEEAMEMVFEVSGRLDEESTRPTERKAPGIACGGRPTACLQLSNRGNPIRAIPT
jgi:hypothetical protein